MTLTSTISGTHTAAITLTSATYANPVTVTGTIVEMVTSYAWSIANSGSIQGAVDGIEELNQGAVVTISNSGRITGAGRGIGLAGGTITNQSGGYIGGAGIAGIGIYAKYHQGATATITNAGTIKGADGVVLHMPGGVTNAAGGTIYGGVYLGRSGVTVLNAGSIGAGGSGTAVAFAAGSYANRLIFDAGATFGGSVYDPAGDSNSTLELAAGTGTGTIGDLFSSFGSFGPVTIDHGAIWSFGTGDAAVQIFDSGTLTTPGDVNQVTVTNGGVLINASGQRIRGAVHGSGGATFANDGSAVGSSVDFAAGAANKVIAGPGSYIGGDIDGGNTLGAVIVSTLEIAGGSGTATLGYFVDFARVDVDSGATWQLMDSNALGAGGTLTNNGVLLDIVDVTTPTLSVQTLIGSGAVTIGSNAMLTLGGVVASGQTIDMTGTADVLGIGGKSSFAGTVKGFGTTGIIDVAGIGFAKSANVSGDALSLYSGINHTGTKLFSFPAITNGSGAAVNPATLSLVRDGDGGTVVACYLRGTRIRTPRGEVPVECLSAGDLVVTAAGGLEPIRWVGRRRYALAGTEGHAAVLPVLIRAGAIGDGLPRRDLNVSPEHALLLDGVLVPARHLTNGTSIVRRRDFAVIEYFHVELATHAAIFAEGLPAETFVDCGTRGLFDNAHAYTGGGAPAWRFCAPRVEEGDALDAIRRRINARAGIAVAGEPGKLIGNLERATGDIVEGWAQDEAAPERPVRLEIIADGTRAAVVLANRYRGDLEAAGLGSGRHAFRVALPRAPRRVEARRVEDGALLGVVAAKQGR